MLFVLQTSMKGDHDDTTGRLSRMFRRKHPLRGRAKVFRIRVVRPRSNRDCCRRQTGFFSFNPLMLTLDAVLASDERENTRHTSASVPPKTGGITIILASGVWGTQASHDSYSFVCAHLGLHIYVSSSLTVSDPFCTVQVAAVSSASLHSAFPPPRSRLLLAA